MYIFSDNKYLIGSVLRAYLQSNYFVNPLEPIHVNLGLYIESDKHITYTFDFNLNSLKTMLVMITVVLLSYYIPFDTYFVILLVSVEFRDITVDLII